jgi:hypothetical protein
MDAAAVPDQEMLNDWMIMLNNEGTQIERSMLDDVERFYVPANMTAAAVDGLRHLSNTRLAEGREVLLHMMKCCKQWLGELGYHQSGPGDVDDSAGMPSAMLAHGNILLEQSSHEHVVLSHVVLFKAMSA